MALTAHPEKGTVLMCDFNSGFVPPEMVKRRPVVVLSPDIRQRGKVCTVVALSTSVPMPVMPYHTLFKLPPEFPEWMRQKPVWLKGDMLYTVSFARLDLIRCGKRKDGSRIYLYAPLDKRTLIEIERCVLRGLGLSHLTKHL